MSSLISKYIIIQKKIVKLNL